MTFLLYIGKNKDFLRKFSKLENVQMIYAQNYQDAITICIRLKVRENIIVLHEQGEMNGDIEQIGAFRKKFYQAYVVLITDRLTPEASKVYLNSGINDTVSLHITTVRGNKRKAESMLREVLLHYDKTGELPTGRGGAYEKVDAKTAKPLPLPLQPVNKSEMLFLDYLNEWVQIHKASIQPATFISYNRMITGRITQYFEPLGLKLCEVTPQVLDEFQEKILLEGYTTNTVIHYYAIFGKAFKDAVRKDYLETNPMLKVDRPKKNSFRPNFYSKDEVQQLLEVSQDDPLHLCILITAYYGLRRSEVLGLKWSSIDFERKSITINHKVTEQLVNGKYVPVVSDVMKNKTSCRTLPLIPAVEEELLKQKEKQQLYRKLFKKSYSTEYLDFVCTDQEGKLIRPNFVTEHFDWLLRKYSLPRIRFHDLRHSCASLMVMNGVSMKQVQEWLGHSTFSTTADIYAHLDYKSKEGSAGVIAGLLETKK